MQIKANGYYRLVLLICILATLVLSFLIFINPPAVFPDAARGFHVLRSMRSGGGFNMFIAPSHDDIAKNTSSFLTWWSPGQYLLPGAFGTLFNISTGRSIAFTILLCSLCGLFGFYCLFRKLAFTPMIAALSIALMACQQFYFIPYIYYNGGELLIFAFSGWYLYGCYHFTRPGWKLMVFVFVTGWIGFYCKSAFLWIYAAGLLCLWINISYSGKKIIQWVRNGFFIGVPAILSLATIYKFFLLKGETPASASSAFRFSFEAPGFPLASPMLAGFSGDDLVNGLLYHPDGAILSTGQATGVLLVFIVLSIGLWFAIIKRVPDNRYKVVVTSLYGVAVLFFSFMFLRQSDISYESRHFRIAGLLFIPGAVYIFSKSKPVFKILFMAICAVIAFSGIQYFVTQYRYNVLSHVYGPSGILQPFIDQSSLDYLQVLDRKNDSAIFVFTSPDLGLDITHNRIIILDPAEGEDDRTYIADNVYNGHSGPLYILLNTGNVTGADMEVIKQCFPGYGNFKLQKLGGSNVLLSTY